MIRYLYKPHFTRKALTPQFTLARLFSSKVDHYAVLGLQKDGLTREILNSRFVNLSKKHHPDISKEEN